MKPLSIFFLICFVGNICVAQTYNRQDSLRGTITNQREWWDLIYYHLDIKVNIENQTVEGSNTILYKVIEEKNVLQIDLQSPMIISKVFQNNQELSYIREGNVYFIMLEKEQILNTINEIRINFSGKPRLAPRPPWDSGMVWKKDSLGVPFAASISWGAGSSQWWPCKDHMYDEVDSMKISINVRKDLVAVANGRLKGVDELNDNTKTYHWFVSNPINNYGVNFNIGNYVNFSEIYDGERGLLLCDYYVLKQNYKNAKKQFEQVPMMLAAFEYWFGPYPFYEDSYKLVEVPYWGMEHQSATAYGNGYKNGRLGEDRSQTGWGDKFDYIIIHESGHEWFACNITFKDIADIWIHEGFTTYSEGLYVEYHYGKKAGDDYQISHRRRIRNDQPMIGHYNVNYNDYSGDNYVKGATILHMLRQIVNDDEKWRHILRGLNQKFYHKTVTTKQIEDYIAEQSGLNLDSFWDQYLRTTQIPIFEYYFVNNQLYYKWTNCIGEFEMPLRIMLNKKEQWIYPKTDWQVESLDIEKVELIINRNFYVPVLYSN